MRRYVSRTRGDMRDAGEEDSNLQGRKPTRLLRPARVYASSTTPAESGDLSEPSLLSVHGDVDARRTGSRGRDHHTPESR